MGLIKAALSAGSSTLADQWLEYIYCERMEDNVLMRKGQPKSEGSNTKGTDNTITNGSKILVPTGTALITMQDGAITGLIMEPGGYIYTNNDPNSRSLFAGDGIISSTLGQSWERFKFGGQPGSEQLAFYVNMQEITGNMFGTPTPISWDDAFLQTQVSASIRGTYAITIKDPMLFVSQFVPVEYKIAGAKVFDFLDTENEKANSLFNDVVQCLPGAFGTYCNDAEGGTRLSKMQRDPIGIASVLSQTIEGQFQWQAKYGFGITKVSILAIEYDEQSAELVKQAQEDDIELRRSSRMGQAYSNNMAGMMAAASASAMNTAAGNENGAMMGFMGMNMANMQANNLMGAATSAAQTQQQPTPPMQTMQQQPAQTTAQPIQEDPYAKLAQLKSLLDQGVITQADFDAAKNKLLGI